MEELFRKKFSFHDECDEWTLPAAETMFAEEPFEVPKLLNLKEQLNSTKAKLDNKDMLTWHKHTNFTNRAGIVIPALRRDYSPELCTQGWAKFHEILWQYSSSLVPESASRLHSVHLCEVPGGFVASLNHLIKTHRMDCKWDWRAMTLNPYFEGGTYLSVVALFVVPCLYNELMERISNWKYATVGLFLCSLMFMPIVKSIFHLHIVDDYADVANQPKIDN